MEFILEAMEAAAKNGQGFPAVVTALIVPDIAGAVDTPEVGSEVRYVRWINEWFIPRNPEYSKHGIDGATLYSLRCKLLHEGLTDPSGARAAKKSAVASTKRLIAFNIGDGVSLHLITSGIASGETFTALGAGPFCSEMACTARDWMSARKDDQTAAQRLKALIDIRMDVPPLAKGVPLLCAEV